MTTEHRAFDAPAFNGHRRARASLNNEFSVNTAGNGKVCAFTFSVVRFLQRGTS